MRILITGGLGFIGSRLAQALVANGHEVVILDCKMDYVQFVEAKVVIGDIAKPFTWDRVPECDIIFHGAAKVSAEESIKRPHDDFNVNVVGTNNVTIYAKRCGASIISCSSIRVYDPGGIVAHMRAYGSVDETCPLVREARSVQPPFAFNKLLAEEILYNYAQQTGNRVIVHRMSSIVGPGQNARQLHGWLSYVVSCAIKGEPYTIFGDGEQVRDILHVDDLVSLVKKEIEGDMLNKKDGFTAYNVGGGSKLALSLKGAIDILKRRHGLVLKAKYGLPRIGEPAQYVSDTSLIEKYGWVKANKETEQIIAELVRQYS